VRTTNPQSSVEKLLARALSCMSSAVSLIDARDQLVVYVNPAFERLTGYVAAEAVGRPWTLVEGPETDRATATALRDTIAGGRELRVRVRHHRQDGRPYWSETFLSPVVDDDGTPTHFIAVQKDVTAQTEAERRAAHLAYHDALTGLPNRTQAQEHLALAVARARRSETALAILFLDLDGFKPANDRHGHEAGDHVLVGLAERWLAVARAGDVLARYGGDEFVLLMTDLPPDQARSAAIAAAERYVAAAREPFTVPGHPGVAIALTASVGIALYPSDGHSASGLLVAADAAMYAAKRGGGSRYACR
jgi:diguanylate cyclase (GGDEF)-like protein/PAS domain S-box-containing protein